MDKIKKIQSDTEKRYIRNKIEAIMPRIMELDPTVPVAQHFYTILRTKGKEDSAYYWDDNKLLGVMEEYYKEFRKLTDEKYDGTEYD